MNAILSLLSAFIGLCLLLYLYFNLRCNLLTSPISAASHSHCRSCGVYGPESARSGHLDNKQARTPLSCSLAPKIHTGRRTALTSS